MHLGTSLVVQWLGLRASTAEGVGSIPGQGTKVPHVVWHSPKKCTYILLLEMKFTCSCTAKPVSIQGLVLAYMECKISLRKERDPCIIQLSRILSKSKMLSICINSEGQV